MNEESLQQVQAYILLLLKNTDLNKDGKIYYPVEEKLKLSLEMMIRINMVCKWKAEETLTYYYVKPTETQFYITRT